MPSDKGYIYCLSNPSMPGILKCGITIRSPLVRLKEANSSDTWRPPTMYQIEFAKKVNNPREKEQQLHNLLERSGLRVHPRREFFYLSIFDAYALYNLMDGTWWDPNEKPVKHNNNDPIIIDIVDSVDSVDGVDTDNVIYDVEDDDEDDEDDEEDKEDDDPTDEDYTENNNSIQLEEPTHQYFTRSKRSRY